MNNRDIQIMALVDDGKTYAEVAETMGVTRSVVAGVVSRNRTTEPQSAPHSAKSPSPNG